MWNLSNYELFFQHKEWGVLHTIIITTKLLYSFTCSPNFSKYISWYFCATLMTPFCFGFLPDTFEYVAFNSLLLFDTPFQCGELQYYFFLLFIHIFSISVYSCRLTQLQLHPNFCHCLPMNFVSCCVVLWYCWMHVLLPQNI